ncbi:glycosyltransferase family 31 protein [Pyrenophora tritici-repentis]|uniref:N-acetylgalactosaminide beta-1,3-galactosyltransferase n=2 Tax=Pyrenophora tritici-repentis TaxID=45151 RepID=A0A2W1FKF1_9PLEO|nr:uncharacterized protein PTRG_03134 [Pyrenophora tritici-repentis Pt-1C-BFP]KAF7451764.1 Glycosyltransferase family 31 protein [Pyrenophora tritici-repentis]EDU45657.1 conserved hypothetical protein [Pyrenophora tritici-repentis Pt-1C-BFP]KAF7575115.1 hypothetical protein PtrM4_067390 [Pyrenophora tritici-repentis]KAG9386122.1 Glycosyltransferase family 31 protein [Pyrenophora tritici-repentis]KAI0569924.1 Glycosyltransferase family 31 protein [Pyrenophora tritici-repentis]
MSSFRKHMPRPARLLLTALLIYAFFWLKGWPREYDDEELPPSKRRSQETPLGPHTIQHEQLVVSVTTTANNAYIKIPPLILNTADEDHGMLLLFSDLQTEVGKWPIFDVIWRYGQQFIKKTEGLERYRAQIEYAQRSIPLIQLKNDNPEEENKAMVMLDKYKILQTMAAAWEYRPGRSWYVFAWDDTYINRPNLVDWLSQHDPKEPHFFGNPPTPPTYMVPDPFAAGGNSFIVSGKIMKELFEVRRHLARDWGKQIANYTYAFDFVSGMIKEELNHDFVSVWPGISGFDPTTIPFMPSLWCEPVLIMHHVAPDILNHLYKMEQEQPHDLISIRFADVFNRFMAPENLNYTRDDWDNLSSESSNSRWNILFDGDQPGSDRAQSGEASPNACRESCEKFRYCVQWSYSSIQTTNWNENRETKCHLSSSIRFGRHTDRQKWKVNDEVKVLQWKSGWNKDKFMAWANHQRCKEVHQ